MWKILWNELLLLFQNNVSIYINSYYNQGFSESLGERIKVKLLGSKSINNTDDGNGNIIIASGNLSDLPNYQYLTSSNFFVRPTSTYLGMTYNYSYNYEPSTGNYRISVNLSNATIDISAYVIYVEWFWNNLI